MGPPLVGVPPQYAVVFLTYGWCMELVKPKDRPNDELTIPRLMLAGAGSGVLTTVRRFGRSPARLLD